MTAIVGVLCQDGVVLGTDSSTTFTAGPQRTIEQPSEKLEIVENSLILAGSGSVGLNQRFRENLWSLWVEDKNFKNQKPIEMARQITMKVRKDFGDTGVALTRGLCAFLSPAGGTWSWRNGGESDGGSLRGRRGVSNAASDRSSAGGQEAPFPDLGQPSMHGRVAQRPHFSSPLCPHLFLFFACSRLPFSRHRS